MYYNWIYLAEIGVRFSFDRESSAFSVKLVFNVDNESFGAFWEVVAFDR